MLPIYHVGNDFGEYDRATELYWQNLQSFVGRHDAAVFGAQAQRPFLLIHDLKMLLHRFSRSLSFSKDSHGGGTESNMQFIPYLLQFTYYNISRVSIGGSVEAHQALEQVVLFLFYFLSLVFFLCTIIIVIIIFLFSFSLLVLFFLSSFWYAYVSLHAGWSVCVLCSSLAVILRLYQSKGTLRGAPGGLDACK